MLIGRAIAGIGSPVLILGAAYISQVCSRHHIHNTSLEHHMLHLDRPMTGDRLDAWVADFVSSIWYW